MRRRSLWCLLWMVWGCSTGDPGAKGAEEGIPDGKGDSASRLIDHDTPIQEINEIGVSFTAQVRAHSWTFHLGTQERVSVYTAVFSGDEPVDVDTVLYLYRKEGSSWGHYIARNDDASDETTFSRIERDLEPGDYRIIVKGFNASVRGQVGVNLRCADGFCDYYDPDGQVDPEEPGVGTPDPVGDGPVSFRVPLIDEGVGELMSRFNSELAAAGLPTYPDYVTVSSESASPEAEFERYQELSSRDDMLAITSEGVMAYGDPSYLVTCYEGDGTALGDFMGGFADGIFSDQLGIWGWRAGTRSAYEEWHEPTAMSNVYHSWRSFDPSSTDVMIIYSTDDEGTEHPALIPACVAAETN